MLTVIGLTGSVSPVYATGMSLSRAGVVAGLDMTTEAALTKLAYLLADPAATPQSIAKDMAVSLRGELTESSQPVFRHPDGALPERVQTLTMLGYAIAQGDLEQIQQIVQTEHQHHWCLNDMDYSGNTPVVSPLPPFYPIPYTQHSPVMIHKLYTNVNSTSPHPRPPWRCFGISSSKVARCICATVRAVHHCSWRRMGDSASMSSCCDSQEHICIRTSGQQLNCWQDGGLKSGDRRVLSCRCIAFFHLLYTSECYVLEHTPLYYYHCSILSPLYYTTLLSALSILPIHHSIHSTYTILYYYCYILGPQMPHLRKENRQLDVHSFFILLFNSGIFFFSLFFLFSLSISPFSSSIALFPLPAILPLAAASHRCDFTRLHSLWTLSRHTLWRILFSVFFSLSLSFSYLVYFLSLRSICHIPSASPIPPSVTGRIVTRLWTSYFEYNLHTHTEERQHP